METYTSEIHSTLPRHKNRPTLGSDIFRLVFNAAEHKSLNQYCLRMLVYIHHIYTYCITYWNMWFFIVNFYNFQVVFIGQMWTNKKGPPLSHLKRSFVSCYMWSTQVSHKHVQYRGAARWNKGWNKCTDLKCWKVIFKNLLSIRIPAVYLWPQPMERK